MRSGATTIAAGLGLALLAVLPGSMSVAVSSAGAQTLSGAPPLIVGHRGASGYRPEHTLAAYDLAIAMGADFIEPDLVATRDGRLIARHEPEIGLTTDAPAKFPDRKTKKMVDGEEVEGWFASDFTLAEIKTLRAKMPQPFRADAWDGQFEVPTFEEVVALAKQRSAEVGRTIGIYPETKHPTYHDQLGLSLEEPLLATLQSAGWTTEQAPVYIQSFEVANLQELAGKTGVRLVQLFDDFPAQPYDFAVKGDKRTYRDLMAPAELAKIAGYAAGIGPWKRTIIEENPDKSLKAANSLIRDAHAAGLSVHAYTFRDEPRFLAAEYRLDPIAEYHQLFALGLDGLFSDFPDTAVRARDAWLKR